MVRTKFFSILSKTSQNYIDKSEKGHMGEHAKDQKGKKKERGVYKGQNQISWK